tara:strand:- start:203 stop:562 length:360 start_codon:yes stop_codon:yes gene_type:complete
MTDLNFELIKEIFSIIKYNISSYEELKNLTLSNSYLRTNEFNEKMVEMIPKLKKKYKSHTLTCLHKNSLEKQRFPTINMIRQILKCNDLKMQPYIVCKGYDPISKHKILERYFIIKEID